MKPNLEITLKFFALMIVFFIAILSIPTLNYLVENNLIDYNHFWALLVAVFVSLPIIIHINLQNRNLELEKRLKKEAFLSDVSIKTVNDYEEQIKSQESQIIDVKQAFSDADEEIKELRSIFGISQDELKIAYERIEVMGNGNKTLVDKNESLVNEIIYWKERALHQKHTKKVVESGYFECISDNYYYKHFKKGSKYFEDNRGLRFDNEVFVCLKSDSGTVCLVKRKDFKSVN